VKIWYFWSMLSSLSPICQTPATCAGTIHRCARQ
jgi:hypothetical protein